jgi:hypothetical protein
MVSIVSEKSGFEDPSRYVSQSGRRSKEKREAGSLLAVAVALDEVQYCLKLVGLVVFYQTEH